MDLQRQINGRFVKQQYHRHPQTTDTETTSSYLTWHREADQFAQISVFVQHRCTAAENHKKLQKNHKKLAKNYKKEEHT